MQSATASRNAGLRVQLYTEQKRFKAKMSYADKLGFPFAILIGEDEIAQGKVSLKDMTTGAQSLLTPDEAAEAVKAALAEKEDVRVIRE